MADPAPRRGPRIRRAPLPDDARIIVRGDDLNPATDIRYAEAFRRRFPEWGRYGLSAYCVRNEEELDDLAADQLERFPMLDIFDRAALEAARFEVVPTFRTPHVTIGFSGDVRSRLNDLSMLRVELRTNPYHAVEPRHGSRDRER